MTTTTNRPYGVWRLTVTGPEAVLDEMGTLQFDVVGFFENGDRTDLANLEFDAANQFGRLLGKESYDGVPERYTPLWFAEPVATHNEWVSPDGDQQFFVAVYSVSRCYGGPEEGGWWFDAGELVRQTAVNSYAEAEELRDRLREGEFADEGPIYSVRSHDCYRIMIGIEPQAESFPEEAPHYE